MLLLPGATATPAWVWIPLVLVSSALLILFFWRKPASLLDEQLGIKMAAGQRLAHSQHNGGPAPLVQGARFVRPQRRHGTHSLCTLFADASLKRASSPPAPKSIRSRPACRQRRLRECRLPREKRVNFTMG